MCIYCVYLIIINISSMFLLSPNELHVIIDSANSANSGILIIYFVNIIMNSIKNYYTLITIY